MTMTFHDHLLEQVRKNKGAITNGDRGRIEAYMKTDGGKEAYRKYQEEALRLAPVRPVMDDVNPSRPKPPPSDFVYKRTPAIAEQNLAELRRILK